MALATSGRCSSRRLRFGFDERHDRQAGDAAAERVVGAGSRGIDVEALGVFGAAPGAVRPLIVEQELDAAANGGGDFLPALGGVIGAGFGPVVASFER